MNMSNRKFIILFIGIILAIVLWFIEKTKLIPQYSYVYYEMGLKCNEECGQKKKFQYFQKAVHHASRIVDIHQDVRISDAHFHLALLYEDMGSHEEALGLFIKATEFNDENSMAQYKTGFHYFQKGDFKSAIKYFRRSYLLTKFPEAMHYYLARAYDETQEYDMAIVHYCTILNLNDEFSDEVYPRLAFFYYHNRDIVESFLARNRGRSGNEYTDQIEQFFEKALAFESPQ